MAFQQPAPKTLASDVNYITYNGSPAQHTHTVIFLHGRGDNANRFSKSLLDFKDSSGRSILKTFPTFRWVFPQAPTRACASDVSCEWPQWFDVWNPRNFAEREELQVAGLQEMVPVIRNIIAVEAQHLEEKGQGNGWGRVILAGISMGAATSVHTLFNLDIPTPERKLAAFLGFSCRLPFQGRTLAQLREKLGLNLGPERGDVLRNTPMLMEHCVDDTTVTVYSGRQLRDTLRAFGAQVVMREYPNGGHWFHSPNGADDVIMFLNSRVLGTAQAGTISTDTTAMDLS